jgi:hypothetical protein
MFADHQIQTTYLMFFELHTTYLMFFELHTTYLMFSMPVRNWIGHGRSDLCGQHAGASPAQNISVA